MIISKGKTGSFMIKKVCHEEEELYKYSIFAAEILCFINY